MSDVFISYAHEDTAFVERLRAGLADREREVWVDTSGIEPADRWRVSANEAIERSDALLFVISRHSLRSDPCRGELEYAASLNKRLIPVCVDEAATEMDKPGLLDELSWIMLRPADDFDAGIGAIVRALDTDLEVVRTHTRILVRAKAWELAGRRASPLLRGDELRLAEQWLARAAASSSPPTELQQDFIAASRQAATRRLRIVAGVATLVAVIAVALSIFALVQRSRAVRQATLATSRQLAALSENERASNLDVALLMAVAAYRKDPNPQARSALFQADLYSPRLARFLPMGGQVAALTASSDRSTVVAGLADGRVMRLQLAARAPAAIASLGAAIKSVAVSANGSVVAAANGSTGVLWRAGTRPSTLRCAGAQRPDAVGVSPSGRTVALHCQAPVYQGAQAIELVDGASGGVVAVHPIPTTGSFFPNDLVVASDRQLLMLDGGNGPWQVRRIPDWSLAGFSTGSFGAHQGLSGYSNDGGFVTVTNGDPAIPVWPTATPTSYDPSTAPFTAQAPISAPTALTVSPSGSAVAIADSGTIYVAPIAGRGAAHESPGLLLGNGSINRGALRFLGDGDHLLSASGDTVALWDLTQFDRLTRAAVTSLPSPCNGCAGALAAVSADGRRIAAVGDNGTYAVVQTLDGTGAPQRISGFELGPPLWDGPKVLLPLLNVAQASGLPADVQLLPPAYANEQLAAAALTGAGHTVTVVNQRGDIYTQNSSTGAVARRSLGPRDLTTNTANPVDSGMAAIDPADGLVAIVDNGVAQITDARSGAVIRRLPGATAMFVAFAGPRLLVQRTDGSLEVWDARGSTRQRVLAGDQSYGFYFPIADSSGDLVARQRSDGSVTFADLSSGTTLATVSAPASPSLELKLGLAFSPDGAHVVTVAQTVAGTTPEIIERNISDQVLVHRACVAAGRNLTASEWRTFVGTSPPSDLTCR